MAIDFVSDVVGMLNSAEFAESVTYTPSVGSARSISAIVDRNPPQSVDGFGQVHAANIVAFVPNDGTLGIDSSALNTGGDTLTISKRVGETATARSIVRLVYHDAGLCEIEIE